VDNYREVELLARKTLGDSGTETIDINVDEPITEMTVRCYVKNDGAVADEVPPESIVSKIEIVDGGTVYYSVNGREASAVGWYDKLRWPAAWYSAMANEGSRVEWPLQFGRYLGDPEYALAPTRLLNPQVKFTWAKNALHLSGSVTLDVNAKTMQGVAPPSKMLATKVIRSWTTAAAGIEEVDLPTDYPFRRLYFRCYEKEQYLGNQWTNARLECDVGKLIVFDMEDDELLNLMERIWGQVEYAEYVAADDGVMQQTHLGTCQSAAFTSMGLSIFVTGSPTLPGYVRMFARNLDGVAQNDVKTNSTFRGLCPENTFCYPFGLPDDPATWFNAPKYGSIKLKITEADAGGAASVLVQQPRPLP